MESLYLFALAFPISLLHSQLTFSCWLINLSAGKEIVLILLNFDFHPLRLRLLFSLRCLISQNIIVKVLSFLILFALALLLLLNLIFILLSFLSFVINLQTAPHIFGYSDISTFLFTALLIGFRIVDFLFIEQLSKTGSIVMILVIPILFHLFRISPLIFPRFTLHFCD